MTDLTSTQYEEDSDGSDNIDELDNQIKELEISVKSIETNNADEYMTVSVLYGRLSDAYLEKWQMTGDDNEFANAEKALLESIQFGKTAAELAASSNEHDQEGEFWAYLGQQANSMYETFSHIDYLKQAIDFYENCFKVLKSGSTARGPALLSFANCLAYRFENQESVDRNMKDIDDAIAYGQEAAKILTGNPIALSDVSAMFLARFEVVGNPADLQTSTNLVKEALETAGVDDSDTDIHVNYANCLRLQYETGGDLMLLEDAIGLLLESKRIALSTSGVSAVKILSNLAQVLHLRYEALGTGSDLIETINNALAALRTAKEENDAPALPVMLSNLASYQYQYFLDNPEPKNLEVALTHTRLAVGALEHDPSRRRRCLYNLASILEDNSRVEIGQSLSEKIASLDEAIGFIEESTQIKDIDVPLDGLQNHLWSRLLKGKYELSGCRDENVLEMAILKAEAAVNASSEFNGYQGGILSQLGGVLHLKYDKYKDDRSFYDALSAYCECADMEDAQDLMRIYACQRAALLHQSKWQWEEAAKRAEAGVNMLPKLALHAINRNGQRHILEGFSDLSNFAAALALQAGWKAGKAFEILETGQEFILRRTLGINGDIEISKLDNSGQALLETLQNLRRRIEAPLGFGWLDAEYSTALDDEISQRSNDIRHAAQLEEKLRTEYGVDLIIRLKEKDLVQAVSDSVIVAFVMTEFRSDALIITSSGVENLKLPSLEINDCAKYYRIMQNTVVGASQKLDFVSFSKIDGNIKQLLAWLWDLAVLPVLKHLGFHSTKNHSSQLPRMHWLTSGILGSFPLHAAGHHEESSVENVPNYVDSSYIPTVMSLLQV